MYAGAGGKDKPVLRRPKGADRCPAALEQAIHQRLPERSLLDILIRTRRPTPCSASAISSNVTIPSSGVSPSYLWRMPLLS